MTNTFTPPPLSLVRLDELAALRAKATPGEWVRGKWPGDIDIVRQKEFTGCNNTEHDDCMVAQTIHPVDIALIGYGHDKSGDNAIFIAAAGTHWDALLSLAREALRLRAAVAAMGEEFPAVNGRQPQCPECFRLGGYEPHDTDCSRGRFFLKLAYLRGMP